MRFYLCSICFFSILSGVVFSKEKNNQVSFSIDSYTYGEATTIDSFINKFYGEIENGDHALSLNTFEFGVNYENFSFGMIKRYDYIYGFSNDTAHLYHQMENNVDFTVERQYQLDLKMNRFEASGIKVGYQWELMPNITLDLASSYLKATDFYRADLSGRAIWRGDDDFEIDAPANINSATNELLSYPKTDAKGQGVSVDIALGWQINQQWAVSVNVKDAYSRIRWRDSLYSQINRWQVYKIKENGKLDTRPALEGRVLDYDLRLIQKWFGKFSYTTQDDWQLFSQIFHTKYFNHYQIGFNKALNENHSVSMSWHVQAKTVELGYYMPYGYIRILADSFDEEKAHAYVLNTGITWPF